MVFRHRLDTIVFLLADPVEAQLEILVFVIVVESTQQTILLSSLRRSDQTCTSDVAVAPTPLETPSTLDGSRDPVLEGELHFPVYSTEAMGIGSRVIQKIYAREDDQESTEKGQSIDSRSRIEAFKEDKGSAESGSRKGDIIKRIYTTVSCVGRGGGYREVEN